MAIRAGLRPAARRFLGAIGRCDWRASPPKDSPLRHRGTEAQRCLRACRRDAPPSTVPRAKRNKVFTAKAQRRKEISASRRLCVFAVNLFLRCARGGSAVGDERAVLRAAASPRESLSCRRSAARQLGRIRTDFALFVPDNVHGLLPRNAAEPRPAGLSRPPRSTPNFKRPVIAPVSSEFALRPVRGP
jgi:hypothetical protein